MSQPKDQTPEGGGDVEPCPYCKGSFPKNLPLVNGETQLQKHIKVFHPRFDETSNFVLSPKSC